MARLCQQVGVLAQPIAGTLDLHDDGVMQQSVEQCRGHDRIAEYLAPLGEAPVRGEDHGALLVAGVDQLEEQIAGAGTDAQVSDLIDLCCARHKSIHVQSAVMWSCPTKLASDAACRAS